MKKGMIFIAAGLLAACAHINKNTVNYQKSLFDASLYYVVDGNGPDKDAARQDALDKMKNALEQAVAQYPEGLAVVPDLLANADTSKVWKEKGSQPVNYFALAVLERKLAQEMLTPVMDALDAKLAGLSSQLAQTQEPFAVLKLAFAMQPLMQQRNAYQELYAFINAQQTGYKTEELSQYKEALKQAMGSVKVAVKTKGPQHIVLLSQITDALNQMGLGVAQDGAEDAPITIQVETTVDGYESERVKGLEWCSSGASVSMVDESLGITFARFHVQDRAGTSRREDSLRRSMQGVGEKAAQEIPQRMNAYLKIR